MYFCEWFHGVGGSRCTVCRRERRISRQRLTSGPPLSTAKLQKPIIMVKHIVLFQLKKDLPADRRHEVMMAFKSGIEALPATIPSIRKVRVAFKINPAEQWDICLESAFDSLADATAYGQHPAHQAVAGALKPHVAARSCVDFEV